VRGRAWNLAALVPLALALAATAWLMLRIAAQATP